MPRAYMVVNPKDNVATALENLVKHGSIHISELNVTITLQDDIPFGHKFALKDIRRGEAVIKYGEKIGIATVVIAPGTHVHVHNLASHYSRRSLN